MNELTQPLCDSIVEYLLGELSPAQMEEFSLHLSSCPRCKEEWSSLQAVHDLLMEADEDTDEEPIVDLAYLRESTLQAAFAERSPIGEVIVESMQTKGDEVVSQTVPYSRQRSASQRSKRMRSVVWTRMTLGIGAAAVLGVFWSMYQMRTGVTGLLDTPLHMQASSVYPSTQGMLMMKQKADMMELTLDISKMPPAPSDGCYELWVVTPGGKHIGYGEFVPNSDGKATVTAMVPMNLSFVQVGVTREPKWGDRHPLGLTVVHMHMPASV